MPQINEYSWELVLLFLIFFLLTFSIMKFFSVKVVVTMSKVITYNLKNFF